MIRDWTSLKQVQQWIEPSPLAGAKIGYKISSESDYGDYYQAVLKFDNDSMNPPDYDYWQLGSSVQWTYRQTKEQFERDIIHDATAYYHFLLKLTGIAGFDLINEWATKYHAEHDITIEKQRRIQDLENTIRWRDARIKELETFDIKKAEAYIAMLKHRLLELGEQLSKIGRRTYPTDLELEQKYKEVYANDSNS
jgi:hypothetical protein